MKRRKFIKTTSTAVTVPMLLGGNSLQALARPALFNSTNGDNDKVLVLIRLDGGNDGLNMVLPLDQYDNLANARANLILPENSTIEIDNNLGLHPKMAGIADLYNDAKMQLIQSVGYPNQNRSHFRSTDIWTSASPADEFWSTGWLGRMFDVDHLGFPTGYPNEDCPDPFAITFGSQVTPTCQGISANYSYAMTDPNNLGQLGAGGNDVVPNTPYGNELQFLRDMIEQTNAYADTITESAQAGANAATYPEDNALATQLKYVAQLLSGGIQTKVFVVTLGGFDTHANQVFDVNSPEGDHGNLLETLSNAMAAFQQDLKLLGLEERVVSLTFSEFGRRIKSNISLGTDHGSAAPLFVFGKCINAGILGDNPEIGATVGDQDGVAMQFDFRDIYGSLLVDWFEIDEDIVKGVLFEDFVKMPIIVDCNSVSTTEVAEDALKDVYNYPNPFNRTTTIHFESQNERVRLAVYDALGSELEVLFDKQLNAGKHEVKFNAAKLPAGNYFYRIITESGGMKTKVMVKV